jgi:hypothetical protein
MENKVEILISNKSDWALFEKYAHIIEKTVTATLTNKNDGLDQRYWDYMLNTVKFTLHLEHYIGIMLYSYSNDDKSKNALHEIALILKENKSKY